MGIHNMRGQKLTTAWNGPPRASERIQHESIEPTSDLSPEALAEFWRLVAVIDSRGCLDRVDLSAITECARAKAELDRAYEANAKEFSPKLVASISLLSGHHRGRLRELGLTITPSSTLVRTGAKAVAEDPIAKHVKLA